MSKHRPINPAAWEELADIKPVRGIRGYAAFSADEQRRIKAWYRSIEGSTYREIAERFGVAETTIYKVITQAEPRATRQKLSVCTDMQIRRLHKRHVAGEPIRTIAATIPCDPSSLQKRFTKLGLPVIKSSDGFIEDVERVKTGLRSGLSGRALRDKLGIRSERFYSCMKTIRRGVDQGERA